MKVTPLWPLGVVKWLSLTVSVDDSLPPQLMDTATTPGWRAAKLTAVSRLFIELSLASTRRILAPGSMPRRFGRAGRFRGVVCRGAKRPFAKASRGSSRTGEPFRQETRRNVESAGSSGVPDASQHFIL